MTVLRQENKHRIQMVQEYFDNFVNDKDCMINLMVKDGGQVRMTEAVLRLASPYLSSMIHGVRMVSCRDSDISIIVPDITVSDMHHVMNILLTGYTSTNPNFNEKELEKVKEISKLFDLTLNNLEIIGDDDVEEKEKDHVDFVKNLSEHPNSDYFETDLEITTELESISVNFINSFSLPEKPENEEEKVTTKSNRKEDKPLLSEIRRIKDDERTSFKRGKELTWIQRCPHCNSWVGRIVEHIKSIHPHLSSRMIKTKCPYDNCDRSVVDIKNHINLVHHKRRNFGCNKCDAKFSSNSHLQKHEIAVHTDLRVYCEYCEEVFKSTTIDLHVRRVHQGIRPSIPCTYNACEKIFGSKADMERHRLGVHLKYRESCPNCGKKMRIEYIRTHKCKKLLEII